MSHVSPVFLTEAFNCPHCNAYAHMEWNQLFVPSGGGSISETVVYQATCQNCKASSIWLCTMSAAERLGHSLGALGAVKEPTKPSGYMLHPTEAQAPMPGPDLPVDCQQDYTEARAIEAQSPRAAAALLRLIIQKLCKHFGEPGKDINTDIGSLVQKGLPKQLQEALDVVRVVGNEAVHPGEINLDDNPEIVSTLFRLVNLIVEKMITEPKQYSELYQSLPAKKLDGIAQRDKPKQAN